MKEFNKHFFLPVKKQLYKRFLELLIILFCWANKMLLWIMTLYFLYNERVGLQSIYFIPGWVVSAYVRFQPTFLSQQEKCTNQFMTFWWPCDPLCVIWNLLFCDHLSGEKIRGYNAQKITPCEIAFKITSEKPCSLIGRTHWPFIQVINTVWSCVGVPPLLQQKTGISVFCDPDRPTICSRWRVW